MTNIAFIAGINNYTVGGKLTGPVNDANEMAKLLAHHQDGSENFTCDKWTCIDGRKNMNNKTLFKGIFDHFERQADTLLFYYAGHGTWDEGAGIVSQNGKILPFSSILNAANNSPARQKIVILECCFSGNAGNKDRLGQKAELTLGTSILTSASPNQYALGRAGRGIFSYMLTEGLQGAAADQDGLVTMDSLYALADNRMSILGQRPTFKAHLDQRAILRKCLPSVFPSAAKRLLSYFPSIRSVYRIPNLEVIPNGDAHRQGFLSKEQSYRDLMAYLRAGWVEPKEWHLVNGNYRIETYTLTSRGKERYKLIRKQ